jgi:glutamate formiminotransferase/formiminotetrahydrofolate cyclodeaminase
MQGRTSGVPEKERIHTAVLSLGLAELGPFDAAAKVVEYRYRGAPKGLAAMRLTEFADELSSDSPAPGGGSVAALCASLSASLTAMVAALTWQKAGMESARPSMQHAGIEAQTLKDWFMAAVDRDTEAFNAVLGAMRLPKKTAEEQARRAGAMECANQGAALVPLEVAERGVRALELALVAAREGNPNSASDAGVAGACGVAAVQGAVLNVRINAPSITDEKARAEMLGRAKAALDRATALGAQVREAVDRHIA